MKHNFWQVFKAEKDQRIVLCLVRMDLLQDRRDPRLELHSKLHFIIMVNSFFNEITSILVLVIFHK